MVLESIEQGPTLELVPWKWKGILRKRGRPRLHWTTYMHAWALSAAGNGSERLQDLLQSAQWDAA
eukprot:1151218-Pyramimonas_sp.AAC.1